MTELIRLRQWQSRLAELLSERLHTAFAWGTHDCCLFGADVVQAVTGHDPASALRGTYTDEASGRELLESLGGVAAIATEALGEPVPVAQARVGDLGLVLADGAQTLAVCIGQQWRAPGLTGLVLLRAAHVQQAWRVGA